MSRRGHIPRREKLPDPLYQSPMVTRFINCMMWDGKRAAASRIFYDAMKLIEGKHQEDGALKVFRKALDNVKPNVEVKSRRVGGSNYQVPVEVRPNRSNALAMRWLISFARNRPEKSMTDRLANELMEAASLRGGAFKKKEDTHRMAEANKAFAHYRW